MLVLLRMDKILMYQSQSQMLKVLKDNVLSKYQDYLVVMLL